MTSYELAHDKELHLIVVRRDLGFQHVHPSLDGAGTGRSRWTPPRAGTLPGVRRLRARPASTTALTLGDRPGRRRDRTSRHRCRRPPAPSDGRRLHRHPRRRPDRRADSQLTLTVTKDGAPVTDLQPYLGAYGHLVALRDRRPRLPARAPRRRPGRRRHARRARRIAFAAEAPTAGRYRLFLDFQHDGVVRTARVHGHRRADRHDRARPRRPRHQSTTRDEHADDPATAPATRASRIELAIGGMTCASCAARIEKKLNRLDGVTATVNYATEKARVDRPRRPYGPDDLIAAVEKTGYTAPLPRPQPTRRRADRRRRRRPDAELAALRHAADRQRRADACRSSLLAMVPACSSLLAVALADPGRAGRGLGRAGRSTGPPGPTCGTAPPPWTP